MARRLISLSELDESEGLVEHHRKLQTRLEHLEAGAAQFDGSVQGVPELGRKADALRRELATLLEQLLTRVRP